MLRSVYLVEDSAVLRTQIIRALEETGLFRIAGSAPRVSAAIGDIRALRPDLVVVDLQLEDGSGWSVIDAVRDIPRHIVILTNHGTPPFRAAAKERGVRHFFDKTSEFDQFLQVLPELAAGDGAAPQ